MKVVAEWKERGYGFPVVLENVPLVKVRGVWTPYINYNNLAKEVLRSLADLPVRLTGNQIKFIRQYFEFTLQVFAVRFGVSHPAVLKWERRGDRVTGMGWGTEKDIRLFVKKEIEDNAKDFLALYARLQTVASTKVNSLRLDAKRVAA